MILVINGTDYTETVRVFNEKTGLFDVTKVPIEFDVIEKYTNSIVGYIGEQKVLKIENIQDTGVYSVKNGQFTLAINQKEEIASLKNQLADVQDIIASNI